jgi:thiamine-phosphate pyrophosphorylase
MAVLSGITAVPRLYAILDTDETAALGMAPGALLDIWLDAGVRLIQLRAKSFTLGPWLALAERAARACERSGARLIINDRADVARLAGAGGVHVGQDDLRPADARSIVGGSAWVGLSTHTGAQVEAALAEPISYMAIGPVFATRTKRNPDPTVGLAGVASAAARAHGAGLPLVAIGGVTVATAPAVIEAGADAIAVIRGLLEGDPAARVAEWLRLLQ